MDALVMDRPSPDRPTEQDPRWASVVSRDRSADATFYYSVTTTGVYCRPSCAARLANPKNVRFHVIPAEAEAAGFRPCKRCRPNQPPIEEQYVTKVADACRLIEGAEEMPTLAELARAADLSTYHFHRVKAVTGLTPKDHQQRVWQALRAIPAGSTASYTDIARRIGVPKAVRAVAAACAANALAVAIPCHRVVRNDGTLSGYRWGVERKRVLIEREGSAG